MRHGSQRRCRLLRVWTNIQPALFRAPQCPARDTPPVALHTCARAPSQSTDAPLTHGRVGYVAAPAASLRPARAGASRTCSLQMHQSGVVGLSRKAAMQLMGLTLAGTRRGEGGSGVVLRQCEEGRCWLQRLCRFLPGLFSSSLLPL